MKHLLGVCCFLLLISCAKNKTADAPKEDGGNKDTASLDYSKYEIKKESLGPIRVGMPFEEADALLKDFEKQEATAYDFGYDGGGQSWIYKYNGEPVFAIVPSRDTGIILAIAAISKNLRSAKGIHPKMTIKELMSFYPDLKVSSNLMMQWEDMTDTENSWEFVFFTTDKNRISEHADTEELSKPKRLDTACDWITIKHIAENDCGMMHSGTFIYKDTDGDDVVVKMNDDATTEEHKDGKYIIMSTLRWISDCEYENTIIMATVPNFSLDPGTVMNVKVKRVEGMDIYFTATVNKVSVDGKFKKIVK